MIGSIGAESRYSTGYNNLKPNRNQNKWADTLAQTVDKEDISSRADINRAKKSTVMDSYLALSGKTINTLKQEYSEYESENYRIVPDNEAECFDIYNKDGERLGAFSYSDIKIRQDETTGKQFLIGQIIYRKHRLGADDTLYCKSVYAWTPIGESRLVLIDRRIIWF